MENIYKFLQRLVELLEAYTLFEAFDIEDDLKGFQDHLRMATRKQLNL
jgi:hypothetical protein